MVISCSLLSLLNVFPHLGPVLEEEEKCIRDASSTGDISSTFNHFQPLSILEHKNKNKLRYVYDVQNIFKRGCIDKLEFTEPLLVEVGHPMCWADSMYLIIRNERTFTKNLFLQQRKKFPQTFCTFSLLVWWVGSIYSMGIEWHSPVSISVSRVPLFAKGWHSMSLQRRFCQIWWQPLRRLMTYRGKEWNCKDGPDGPNPG